MVITAVIFDFIGTLVTVQGYSYEKSIRRIYGSLLADGYQVDYEHFRRVYKEVHHKYAMIRYEKCIEVTNAVWLSETLNCLGFATKPEDERVKKAINVYFEDYLHSLRSRRCALQTLKKLSGTYALALVSNFTYAPVIYAGLRKLHFNLYFNAVLVSQEVGWRKPHPKIFEEAIKRIRGRTKETVFVGDNPVDDIQGAKNVGMEAIFIPSQFFTIEDAKKTSQQPDVILNDLCQLPQILSKMGVTFSKLRK